MDRKGRRVTKPTFNKVTNNKITRKQAEEIRILYNSIPSINGIKKSREVKKLKEMSGLCTQQIYNIIRGKSWVNTNEEN
jgi:hypothetical protein